VAQRLVGAQHVRIYAQFHGTGSIWPIKFPKRSSLYKAKSCRRNSRSQRGQPAQSVVVLFKARCGVYEVMRMTERPKGLLLKQHHIKEVVEVA